MKPNILILMVDQLHYQCLGYRKDSTIKTPNLDRLKTDAVEFSRCYAQNAFCVPSRASYMTGQYLFQHRQYGFTGLLDENTVSMPSFFKRNGYGAYHIGKAHLNCMQDMLHFDKMIPTLPEDMAFSTDMEDNYQSYCHKNGIDYPTDQIHGGHIRPPVKAPKADAHYFRASEVGSSHIPEENSLEKYTADKAISILNGDHHKPFFLHVSFDRPHVPLSPSEPYDALYDPESIVLPESYTEDQLSLLPQHIQYAYRKSPYSIERIKDYNLKSMLAEYYGLITHIDHEIGRILAVLKEKNLYENTIVLFYSDHGDMAGHNGLISKFSNTIFHDHIIRTPLLMKLPGQEYAGMEIDSLTESIDLFPTLASLCGLDASKIPLPGKNLAACFKDAGIYRDNTAFSESYSIKTVVKGVWKLIYYVQSSEGELYQLADNPQERNNLYHHPANKDKVTELKLEIVKKMTPAVSEERKCFIRSLFDNNQARQFHMMEKLDRWNKGIQDGGGFWMVCRDSYRLAYLPFDGSLIFKKYDDAARAADAENHEIREALIDELLDYLSLKIRPISLMAGNQADWDSMIKSRGQGLC